MASTVLSAMGGRKTSEPVKPTKNSNENLSKPAAKNNSEPQPSTSGTVAVKSKQTADTATAAAAASETNSAARKRHDSQGKKRISNFKF